MYIVSNRFILNYIEVFSPIVYGGYCVIGKQNRNLRYLYERKSESSHKVSERNKNCHIDFHTSNYCIDKKIQLAYPIDTTFQGYGYEDVAYGAKLNKIGLSILHINNPVGFCDFESNETYLQKVEESLYSLYIHQKELQGYSRIINITSIIRHMYMHHIVRYFFILSRNIMRKSLITNPHLLIFSLYKIGYYIHLIHCHERA